MIREEGMKANEVYWEAAANAGVDIPTLIRMVKLNEEREALLRLAKFLESTGKWNRLADHARALATIKHEEIERLGNKYGQGI